MQVAFSKVEWPYAKAFRISYKTSSVAECVQVTLRDGGNVGRGEACGVSYHGETVDTILAQLESVRGAIEAGVTRDALQTLLPAGGARNGVDCALWDLEAKRAGKRVWELAGLPPVHALRTDCTIGIDTPDSMAADAASMRQYPILKIKLGGKDGNDLARIEAIRAARPDVELTVDANQGWTEQELHDLAPRFATLGVKLIEQPLPAGADEALRGFESAVPLCADESCQTTASLPSLRGKYSYVNIKLDKTGGLTEALRLAEAAQAEGFRLMVGCMAGSSLGMAPAFVIGQQCDFVDLDGPLLGSTDIEDGIAYDGGQMGVPSAKLWG